MVADRPTLGENAEVPAELGYSPDEIVELEEEGAIGTSVPD